jgi:hypothetical protein
MNALRGGIGCVCHCDCSCTCSCSNKDNKTDKDDDAEAYNHAHKGGYADDGQTKQMTSYFDAPIDFPPTFPYDITLPYGLC